MIKNKITLITIISISIILTMLAIATKLYAAEYATRTLVIPFNGESALTIVFRNLDSGNLIDADDGTSTASTAWDDAEIEGSLHAASGDWVFTIPTTSVRNLYFTQYAVAKTSVAKTTTPDRSAILYDPSTGRTYTDTALPSRTQ